MNTKMLLTAVGLCLTSTVGAETVSNDSLDMKRNTGVYIETLSPTYLENVYQDGGWDSNWFLSLQGGGSSFLGKPIGHGDLFDRFSPLLNVSFGKWHTPYVGSRLNYQGIKFKDSNLQSCRYYNIQGDFLYNLSSHFRHDSERIYKWDVIPYLGAGVVKNKEIDNCTFALSIGVIGKYRIAHRLQLTGELGCSSALRYFDGTGESNSFGDKLLCASIGLTVNIGRMGWKRVIDAKPYILQNDLLIRQSRTLEDKNNRLEKKLEYDSQALAEMRKIIEIEGLLEKYQLMENATPISVHPKNNYSGLNALRARLRNHIANDNDSTPVLLNRLDEDSCNISSVEYLRMVSDGKFSLGAPIFFFFKIKTADLTDASQVINAEEIAKVMKKYNLYAHIVGAADSNTGSQSVNESLSESRANYIAGLLQKYGVPESHIQKEGRGGINEYSPIQGNRNTCVLLYVKN